MAYIIFNTLLLCACLVSCVETIVPSNIPHFENGLTRNELIKIYFLEGLKYSEIVLFLFCYHKIKISVRQLKRVLQGLNLRRRPTQYSPVHVIINIIKEEMRVSGECIGYRSMWKRLMKDHGVVVKRNEVMQIMRHLNPNATEQRKAHKLKRRIYSVRGPNYVWHIDGYDKLKPFGFCIHGCIDGYSRRIMWLEVASSNNDPAVIAKYYLDCLKHFQLAPRILRADNGTENNRVSFLQPLFRYHSTDSMAGIKSFMYGKSTANQKIEQWWGAMRKLGIHWWINFFKDLWDSGLFDIQNMVIKECVRFCFMDALQTDLDRIAQHWNSHDIRRQKRYVELPSGKPDVMYFVPEITNGYDFKTYVNPDDVNVCIQLYGKEKETCSAKFKEIINIIKPGVRVPVHPYEALLLFIELNDILETYLS